MSTFKLVSKSWRAGQVAVEALLVVIIFGLLIFGGIELSRGVAIRQTLDSGTSAATRALSLDPAQWGFATNLVQQSVNQNVMGTQPPVTMQVYDTANTLRSSADGRTFDRHIEIELHPRAPNAPGLYRPDLTGKPTDPPIHWGIAMATYKGDPYLTRFETQPVSLPGWSSSR